MELVYRQLLLWSRRSGQVLPSPLAGSDRQNQRFCFRVLQAKQTVFSCSPAGEQKQGHVDPEFPFKQDYNTLRLTKSAGTNRPAQTLTRLIGKRRKQFVQAVLLQRPHSGDPADPLKAEIQISHIGSQNTCQVWNLNRLAVVGFEILKRLAHKLQWVPAPQGAKLDGLLRPGIAFHRFFPRQGCNGPFAFSCLHLEKGNTLPPSDVHKGAQTEKAGNNLATWRDIMKQSVQSCSDQKACVN